MCCCCCIDPNEPPVIRRGRATAAVQIFVEGFLFIFSLSTVRDGGYLGVAASMTAGVGCVAVLSRCLPTRSAFDLMMRCNFAGCAFSVGQIALLVRLLSTVDEWCCKRESTSKDAMRTLLVILALMFGAGAALRFIFAVGPAKRARKFTVVAVSPETTGTRVAYPSSGGAAVVVGVPVVESDQMPVVQGQAAPAPTTWSTTDATIVTEA
jgi:hypothetical protein